MLDECRGEIRRAVPRCLYITMGWGWGQFGDYVSVDEKRRRADALVLKLEKQGRQLSPVRLTGRSIANTFWGKSWCQNLESYGSYASRLPRGRSYVRNGAVLDLQIGRGSVTALVSGTELYDIKIRIEPLDKAAWQKLKGECAGKVGSLIDLLRGKLSGPVMDVITRRDGGLFPKPAEIKLDCSCPDYADLCKHLAAVLYGVGARLDHSPELLFTLRGVDHLELFSDSTQNLASDLAAPGDAPTLDASDLAAVFGIELEPAVSVKIRAPEPGTERRASIPQIAKAAKPRAKRAASSRKRAKPDKAAAKRAESNLSPSTLRKKSSTRKGTSAAKPTKTRHGPRAVAPLPIRKKAKNSVKGKNSPR